MKLQFKTFILVCTVMLTTSAAAAEMSPIEVKTDSLRQLQDLRTANVKRLEDIDQALAKKIASTTSHLAAKEKESDKEVETLKAAKHEHVLRQAFLDRLIFQFDTKFVGGDLRTFLEQALTSMAKVDATSITAETNQSLWKFFKYSADAIRRLPEQKENLLSFLEGYMNRSVSNPVLPEDYLASRNYTNGAKSESGKPLNRDEVGAIADRRLRQVQPTGPEVPRVQ